MPWRHPVSFGQKTPEYSQGSRRYLERRLCAVVVVVAVEALDVQTEPRRLRKRLEDVRDHLARELAQLLPAEAEAHNGARPRRNVDDGARQRLVQRAICMPVARNPAARAQGLVKRLQERGGGAGGGGSEAGGCMWSGA